MYNNQKRVELVKNVFMKGTVSSRGMEFTDYLRYAWFYSPFLQERFMWWQDIHRWLLRACMVLSYYIKMQAAMCL